MTNRYEIRGETTVVYLGQLASPDLECRIDTEDLPLVSRVKNWVVSRGRRGDLPYAGHRRKTMNPETGEASKIEVILMHRLVMQSRNPRQWMIDHINGDRLDNRKSNLRVASATLNTLNRRHLTFAPNRAGRGFSAYIGFRSKQIRLGSFDTEDEAIIAHHAASMALQYVEAMLSSDAAART